MKSPTTTTVLTLISTLIKTWQLSPLQADRNPTLRLTNTSLLMLLILNFLFIFAMHCICSCCWSWRWCLLIFAIASAAAVAILQPLLKLIFHQFIPFCQARSSERAIDRACTKTMISMSSSNVQQRATTLAAASVIKCDFPFRYLRGAKRKSALKITKKICLLFSSGVAHI